jgi:uncharacterized protein YdeI (YjbR/CyaY-like superfamily)
MGTKDKRVDLYIAKSGEFAEPILNHLRELVHKICPEVEETMKWSFPHFDYKGIMCSMAAFKQHCSFGFWKTALMKDAKKMLDTRNEAMGSLGRITSLKDLPADKVIIGYIKEAMKLNDDDIKVAKPKSTEKKELVIPKYFTDAIKKNKKALATFENFSYTNKKDYVEWITEAKIEETRNKRLMHAIEWMAEGKIRNWKYVK